MSPNFLKFLPFVKEAETVYKKGHHGDDNFVVVERDSNDPGGITKWGLDARTHGKGVAKLSWQEATQIYWDWYWCGKTDTTQWVSCETIAHPSAEILFDTRINCGFKPAKNILVQSMGDCNRMLDLRDARYRAIVKYNPKMGEYLQGWLNRDANLRKLLCLPTSKS